MEQGVEPDVGVGPGIEGPVAELGHLGVEVLGQLGDLGLRHPVDAHRRHQVVDPPGRDALDVGLADHADQGLFGPAPGFEERRQVAALAELGDLQVDGAGPGVPAALPVAVSAVDPALGPLAVAGVAEHVDVGVHEQLGCHLHHLCEQVTSSIGLQVLAHELCRAHRVGDFHRIFSFVFFGRNLKIDAVVVASGGPSGRAIPRTPLWWTQLTACVTYSTLAYAAQAGRRGRERPVRCGFVVEVEVGPGMVRPTGRHPPHPGDHGGLPSTTSPDAVHVTFYR